MGIECYVSNWWSHAKCEKITFFGKKGSIFRWMCDTWRNGETKTLEKIGRLLITVVGVIKEITQMKKQLLETFERSIMEKVYEVMAKTCQMKEEINELKDTTEAMKNEVIRMKKA